MKMKEFAEEIRKRISGKIEDVLEIKIKPVLKNNSKKLTAFVFQERVQKVTPTIYLDEFYVEYIEQRKALDEIAEQIIGLYRKYRVLDTVDVSFVQDWDKVKERIVYRLINKEQNKKLLKQVPYEEIFDLAKVFYVAFDHESFMLINHGFCKKWNVTKEDLVKVAEQNTPRLFPMQMMMPEDVIRKIFDIEETETVFSSIPMYFITNQYSLYGAGAILYPKVLSELAEKLNSDLYLLPSSIHEFCIIKAEEDHNQNSLIAMVREINKNVVDKEEFLGNNIYLYQRKMQSLSVITEKE